MPEQTTSDPQATLESETSATWSGVVEPVELASRIRAHARDSYLVLYSVMKGASMAAAVYSLDRILQEPYPALLLPWVASLLLEAQTYYSTMVGAQLLPAALDLPDVLLPMLVTVAETELFFILIQDTSADEIAMNWLLAYAGFAAAVATLLAWVRIKLKAENYKPNWVWTDVVEEHRRRVGRDRLLVAGSLVVALAVGLPERLGAWGLSMDVQALVAGGLVLAVAVGGLRGSRNESSRIRRQLARPR